MGRYLSIGIATELCFEKKEAEDVFDTVSNAIDHVVKNYAPSEIYDMTENARFIGFKLKDKILETELHNFLNVFYSDRMAFDSSSCEKESILSAVSEAKSAEEIITLAKGKPFEHFQLDSYWEPISIKGNWGHYLYLNMEGIDLSLDGKIMMECYGSLFRYMTFVLRERYKEFQLSKTLRVTISG